MKNLLLLGFILFSMNVLGQVHSVGIQGGVNLSNCTSEIDFDDLKFKPGLLAGLNYEYLYKSNYTLGADLLYSEQGYIEEVKFVNEQGNISTSELSFGYDYLSVPVKWGYTMGGRLKEFVKVGLCPSVLVKAYVAVPKDDVNLLGYEDLYFYDNVPKFDLGGLLELGAAYALKNDLELFSSLTFRKSFTSISSDEHFAGADLKHYLFSMSVGLKYRLKAKSYQSSEEK